MMPPHADVLQWEHLPFPKSLRFNRRFYPFNAFRSLLGGVTRGQGPTYDGLYEGTWKHPRMASHHD